MSNRFTSHLVTNVLALATVFIFSVLVLSAIGAVARGLAAWVFGFDAPDYR